MRNRIVVGIVASAAAIAIGMTGCSASGSSTTSEDATKAKSATSASDLGGMAKLIAAAKKEGSVNVIGAPDDWANYGAIKKAFTKKYGVKVVSQNMNASSKEEISAADKNRGTKAAPDVFDLGINVATSSTKYFAPYKVANWEHIPGDNKESTGLYYNDYTGVMSVGYNATKFGTVSSLDDLTDAKFKGTVAVNGKPAEAGAAFNGFLLANIVNGGTLDNGQPGIDYFEKLAKAGTFNAQDVTPGSIQAGQQGVVIDWSYNQLSTQEQLKAKGVDWKIFVPEEATVQSFYSQAVNKDAPHPAAARLWEEFLYSPEGQNLWLKGGSTPVLTDWMKEQGTLDEAAFQKLPKATGKEYRTTPEQAQKMTEFLQQKWEAAIS